MGVTETAPLGTGTYPAMVTGKDDQSVVTRGKGSYYDKDTTAHQGCRREHSCITKPLAVSQNGIWVTPQPAPLRRRCRRRSPGAPPQPHTTGFRGHGPKTTTQNRVIGRAFFPPVAPGICGHEQRTAAPDRLGRGAGFSQPPTRLRGHGPRRAARNSCAWWKRPATGSSRICGDGTATTAENRRARRSRQSSTVTRKWDNGLAGFLD